jgi:hypothetical protein
VHDEPVRMIVVGAFQDESPDGLLIDWRWDGGYPALSHCWGREDLCHQAVDVASTT